MHFPTKFLLSSCSLVSKAWNREARRVIRDHRQCTIHIHGGSKACQIFCDLDQLCALMVADGRVFPWNRLKFSNYENEAKCSKIATGTRAITYDHLSFQLHLKHLQLCGFNYKPDCPAHKQILAWLRQEKRHQLVSLQLGEDRRELQFLEHLFLAGNQHPQFVRLEEIAIFCNRNASDFKWAITQLFEAAPNLKRIDVAWKKGLELVPEDKYELLKKFSVDFKSRQDDTFVHKMLKHPTLRPVELEIILPDGMVFFIEGEAGYADLCRRSGMTICQLLAAFHQSLRTLRIRGLYPNIFQLPLIPMNNLSKLSLRLPTMKNEPNLENAYQHSICAIDYGTIMPNLEEIEVESQLRTSRTDIWDVMRERFEESELRNIAMDSQT